MQRGLPWRIYNDRGVEPGTRRSLSADIAIVGPGPAPLLVAEFKYEPSHARSDVDPRKLPVTGWASITADVVRARRWVDEERTLAAVAILIDEGGAMRRRPAMDGCVWQRWGSDGDRAIDVWVHVGEFVRPHTVAESETVGA